MDDEKKTLDAPEEWSARVMEAAIKAAQVVWMGKFITDEALSQVLLEMRVGSFHHQGLFRRYDHSCFLCLLCGLVLVPTETYWVNTRDHLELHRHQVEAVLAPDRYRHTPPSWEHTNTPTLEEMQRRAEELRLRGVLASWFVPKEKA